MERKKIAVFISALYEDMVRETVEGLLKAAGSENVKLIFFTSFADNHTSQNYDRYQDYDTGDFVVYLLPDMKEYDALISFDTYMTGSFIEPINRLKKAVGCPVITLGTVKEGTYSVVNAQGISYAELIKHLVDVHSCRDLVHVSGPRERTFCIERIEIFQDTLKEYGIPCGEDRIYYGTLRPECGEDMVQQIIADYAAKGEKKLPDAIVCVNDYTAIGVIRALESRGFKVPTDVIVTGYDDILRAQFNEPSITTSAQPFFRVGQTGMETLIKVLNGETAEAVTAVPGVLCRRQSCGCEPLDTYRKDMIREKYIRTVSNLESLALSNTNLILGGAVGDTVEEIYNEIEEGCLRETGFKDAVLCLIDGWEQRKLIQHRYTLKEETFNVVCGSWQGKSVKRQRLRRGQLLPDEMMDDDTPYYIFPVHHLQYFLGYFIVNPELKEMEQLHIKSWLVSISTVLVNWFFRNQLKDTVDELEVLYQTDMLTGLYNRRGYYRFFESYYEECRTAGTELAVFLIDMNGMKRINDRYGHAEGDFCLCTIAEAMQKSARQEEICIRTGGDEFVVLAKNYDQAKEQQYIRNVREFIAQALRRSGKNYQFSVSIGCYRNVPAPGETVSIQSEAEQYLRNADQAMYEEKQASSERRE
ncbi:MAG: GGDEF domain-containing protein [Clostridiales bacterium]|nr:GGDEF domain-containing protein [Clostridiales bacterium]